MLSEPADPQRMPYPLPLTQFPHNLKIKAAPSGCYLLTSAQHWIQSHPSGWLENFRRWAWLPLFANGYLDFLTSRTQKVRIGGQTSLTLALSTGAPQSCVLTPLLFTLCTHDCTPRHQENNQLFNIGKTMELIVEFLKMESKTHFPVYISGAEVEEFYVPRNHHDREPVITHQHPDRPDHHWHPSSEHHWYWWSEMSAQRIFQDDTQQATVFLNLLSLGKSYKSIRCCTTWLRSSFISKAARLLNSASILPL